MEQEREEQRRKWRERQQRSRKNRAAAEAEKEFAELKQRDPIAARIQEIMAQVAQEPRRPQPSRVPPEPPQPARLPTLEEWLKCLRQIKTQAAAEEIRATRQTMRTGRRPRGMLCPTFQ